MHTEMDGPSRAEAAVVLLHPHPHFGGDRFHPFVEGCYRRLSTSGRGAVRFDFSSADAETACDEVRGAIRTARDRWPEASIVLAGYSFGASMAARVADGALAGWLLVAPPEVTIGDATIGEDPRPKRVIVPEDDQFASPAGVAEAIAGWRAVELSMIPGDHYLLRALPDVIDKCISFVDDLTRRGTEGRDLSWRS